MLYFILIFIILNILIFGLDFYFYTTITRLLEFKNINSDKLLNSLGYYNKSIFSHRFYGVLLSFIILLIIYCLFFIYKKREDKKLAKEISYLEESIKKVQVQDYKLDIEINNKFTPLRDEIYKLLVSLKSLEEEATRQKLSLKEDISNIAHQLKTPITSIGFMVELIYEDRENTVQYLSKLEDELTRLNNFTTSLLKLSKINSNTIDYKFENLSILEIIKDIIGSLKKTRPIEIVYLGEDFNILGDEIWLYEAFLNIIKNSLDHTRSRLVISLDSNPIYRSISISDNGPGLDEKVLDRIFHRFYRGDTSLPGYGIGLSLSKKIIEKHQGDITAFNNEGLTFEIRFYNLD